MALSEILQYISAGGFWTQAIFFLIFYSALILIGSFLRKKINTGLIKKGPKDEYGGPQNTLMLYCAIKGKCFPFNKEHTVIEGIIRNDVNASERTLVVKCPFCCEPHFVKLSVRCTGLPQKYKRGQRINKLSSPYQKETELKSKKFIREYESGRLKCD